MRAMLLFAFADSYNIKGKVDLHIASGFVYYTDNSTSTTYKGIYRTKTNGGTFGTVVSSGIGKRGIHGLAVDWIAGMMLPSHPLSVAFTGMFMVLPCNLHNYICLTFP